MTVSSPILKILCVVGAGLCLSSVGWAQTPPPVIIETAPQQPAFVPNGDDFGLLDAGNGGLGQDLWYAVSNEDALKLIAAIPVQPGSPSIADLQRRLLLTAAAPGINVIHTEPELPLKREGQDDWLLQRARILHRMGLSADAAMLLEPFANDPANLRTAAWYDDALQAGDTQKVCMRIGATRAALPNEITYRKIAIFCQALGGKPDEAVLAADLLADQGSGDPAFSGALQRLADPSTPIGLQSGDATGLNIALMRAAKIPFPPEWASAGDFATLDSYANDAATDPALRRDAMEQLVAAGIEPPEKLASLYRAMAGQNGSVEAGAETNLEDMGSIRAVLFTRAERATTPSSRALTFEDGLKAARTTDFLMPALRLYAPVAAQLKPGAQTYGATLDAARALHLTGQDRIAWSWRNYLEKEQATRADAATLLARLRMMAVIAGDSTVDPVVIAGGIPNDHVPAHVAAVLSGLDLPDYAVDPAAPNDVAIIQDLERAAAAGRRGEVVALSLIALNGETPGKANPAQLAAIIRALSDVGLEREARRIGLDAAIEAGL